MRKKSIFLMILVMIIVSCASASADYFTVGPEVGYEHVSYHASDQTIGTKGGNGFRIGANATFVMNNGIFIQSGLYYSLKGAGDGGKLLNIAGKAQFPTFVKEVELRRIEYLTLPLTIGYEFQLPRNFAIGLNAGGYIASGIGDGSTYFILTDNEENGGNLFDKTEFTHYNPDTNSREPIVIKKSGRIDAGIIVGANVKFKDIQLKVFYQIGMNKTIYDIATPNTLGLALAYNFRL